MVDVTIIVLTWKRGRWQKSFSEEAANLKQNFRDIDSEDVGGNGEHPVLLEADAIEVLFLIT